MGFVRIRIQAPVFVVMNIRFEQQLSTSDESRWIEFWRNSYHGHPEQHPLAAMRERGRGRTPLFVLAEVGERICAVALLSIHPLGSHLRLSAEVICRRGPVFDDPVYGRAIIEAIYGKARALRAGSVRISPDWTYPEAGVASAMLDESGFHPVDESTAVETGRIYLRLPAEDILAGFSVSTRKDIRLMERRGMTVRSITSDSDLGNAFRCIQFNQRRVGMTRTSMREFRMLHKYILASHDHGILLGAFREAQLLGVLAVMWSPRVAYPILYAVDAREARAFSNASVGPMLWWQAMLWARDRGCAWFDVEGSCTQRNPSHHLFEVAQFKNRFHPEQITRMNEYERVCHRGFHAAHVVVRKSGHVGKKFIALLLRPWRIRRGQSRPRIPAPLLAAPGLEGSAP